MTRQPGLLLQDVELLDGRRLDVRISAGRVAELGALQPHRGERVEPGSGGALSVGLADHHLHLLAMAAAAESLDVSPSAAPDEARLEALLRTAVPDSTGWIRGVGYAEQARPCELALLDRVLPTTPARLQHRSGAMWLLNSAGLAAAGIEAADGRLWRDDADLAARLPAKAPPDLRRLGRELAGYGITSVTDATPDLPARSQELISAAVANGHLPQRVMLLGADELADPPPGLTLGPRKILLSDHALPALAEVRELVLAARAQRRPVAVHCVTREALALTIAVLDEVGSVRGDRIEHAALVDRGAIAELSRLGVTVVTQPGFIADRGDDYLRDLPGEEDDLYRLASLHAAGVPVACSSDAPYGPADPWVVLQAAAERRTPAGRCLGTAELWPLRLGLEGYLSSPLDPGGPPRRVAVGEPADLVLLREPWEAVVAAPAADLVRFIIYGGQIFE